MKLIYGVSVLLFLAGCETSEWVHATKPQENFASDWNACENQAYQDPKLQGGMKLHIQRHIERCLAKEGWVLREKR